KALLESIVAHPSQTLKNRAKKALNDLSKPSEEKNDSFGDFEPYFKGIMNGEKNAWDLEDKKFKFMEGGRLSSIQDPVLRNRVATNLIKLIETYAPKKSDYYCGTLIVLPNIITSNMNELLNVNANNMVQIFLLTFSKKYLIHYTHGVELKYMFSPKVEYWRKPGVDISPLTALFIKLNICSACGKDADLNSRVITEILEGAPIMPIIQFLITEAFLIGNKLLKRPYNRTTALEINYFKAKISSFYTYINKIIIHVCGRYEKTAKSEAKKASLSQLSEFIKQTIDLILQFNDDFEAENKLSNIYTPNELGELHVDFMYRDLFKACKKEFVPYIFCKLIGKLDFLTSYGCKVLALAMNAIRVTQQKVSNWPEGSIEAPYSGESPEWDDAVILQVLVKYFDITDVNQVEKIDAATHGCAWTNISSLSNKTRAGFRKNYDSRLLAIWIKESSSTERTCQALEMFFAEFSMERNQLVWNILEIMKEWKDVSGSSLELYKTDLRKFLDIRNSRVRKLLTGNLRQVGIEKRVTAIREMLVSTANAASVDEDIKTFETLFSRIQNEMRLNMDQIFGTFQNFYDAQSFSRFFESTNEQCEKLAHLFSTLHSNNLAAVSPSLEVTKFLETLAHLCLSHFIGTPQNTLFTFAIDFFWHQSLFKFGESRLLEFRLAFENPPHKDSNELELKFRKAEKNGFDLFKILRPDISANLSISKLKETAPTNPFGLFMIPEGSEDQVVNIVTKCIEAKFESLVEDEKIDFESSMCNHLLMLKLCGALCLRWTRSQVLVEYFKQCIKILQEAENLQMGSDRVLNWDAPICKRALEFVKIACNTAPRENFYNVYSELRMQSTEACDEAASRFKQFKANDYSFREVVILDLFRRSPSGSALSMDFVMQFVLKNRPDLIDPRHVSDGTAVVGLFNPTVEEKRLKFAVNNQKEIMPLPISLLLKSQADVLKQRYIEEALDKTRPMKVRLLAASQMMNLDTISVHEVATFLVSSSLPTRVKESILMYLPKINEPISAINILLSPTFLESDILRTVLFSIGGILKHMPDSAVIPILKGLVPSPNAQSLPVLPAFKEILQLLFHYSHIPVCQRMLADIWSRDDIQKNFRVAFVQKLLGILDHSDKGASQFAWDIISQCVHPPTKYTAGKSNIFEEVGMVLVLVTTPKSEIDYDDDTRYLSYPNESRVWPERYYSQFTEVYTYGNLPITIIASAIRDRYASEVLAPLTVSLYKYLLLMKQSDLQFEEMMKRLVHCCNILLVLNFVTAASAAKVAEKILPALRESAENGDFDPQFIVTSWSSTKEYLFVKFASIMGYCAGVESSEINYQKVPKSWTCLAEVCKTLATIATETIVTKPEVAVIAGIKLDQLSLDKSFLWGSRTSQSFRKAAMDLCDAIDFVSEKARTQYKIMRWNRQISVLKQYITHDHSSFDSKTAERIFQLRSNNLLTFLESVYIFGVELDGCIRSFDEQIAKCIQYSVKESKEVTSKLEVVLDSPNWGSKISGFKVFRPRFIFAVMQAVPKLCTTTRLVELVAELLKTNQTAIIEDIGLAVAYKTVEILRIIRKNYIPQYVRSDISKLARMLTQVSEKFMLSENSSSKLFKILSKVAISDIDFFLEICPVAAANFLSSDLLDQNFKHWIAHLSDQYCNEQAAKIPQFNHLKSKIVGIPAVQPLIENLFKKSLAFDLNPLNENTEAFVAILSKNLRFVMHIFPGACKYIEKHPSFPPFIRHLNTHGPEIAAAYLECVLDGRLSEFDISAIATALPAVQAKINLRKNDDVILAKAASVFEAADAFVKYFSTTKSSKEDDVKKCVERYVTPKSREFSESFATGIAAIDSLPRIGNQYSNDAFFGMDIDSSTLNSLEFVVESMTSRIAACNPYLYLKTVVCFLESKKLQAFETHNGRPHASKLCVKFSEVVKNTLLGTGEKFPILKIEVEATLKVFVDLVRILLQVVAAYYRNKGLNGTKDANFVRWLGGKILLDIVEATSGCCFAVAEKTNNAALLALASTDKSKVKGKKPVVQDVYDLMVLEAAAPTELLIDGEVRTLMVVNFIAELSAELYLGGDLAVHEIGLTLHRSEWKLRWHIIDDDDE
ncbi:hypothetical protein HK100_011032, partial [Physocladia obscura]